MKGFNAKVISAHQGLTLGDIIYMKPVEFRFSTPTLYAILRREDGRVYSHVDANEFKNRFELINK